MSRSRRPWGDERGFRQQYVRRYLPDDDEAKRMAAWADLKDALIDAVVPPLERLAGLLQRAIDRLRPPEPSFERGLAEYGRRMGAVVDGVVGFARTHPDLVAAAIEIEEWRAKAAALGAVEDEVDVLVEEAARYAAEHGIDPMHEARRRWSNLYDHLARGETWDPSDEFQHDPDVGA